MSKWPWKDGSGPKWHAPRALRMQLKRRASACRGGDYHETSLAIQKKSRPSPSNCVTPFSCKLLPEQGFGFRKANVVECRVFASHFPSDEVQNEAEVRRSTPVSARDWSKNTSAVAVLIKFALYWASLIFLRAMQLEVELLSAIVALFVDSFLPFLQSGPGNSRGVVVVWKPCRVLKSTILFAPFKSQSTPWGLGEYTPPGCKCLFIPLKLYRDTPIASQNAISEQFNDRGINF